MPIDLDTFIRLRPYQYHITVRENLSGLRRTGVIEPAATLMQRSGRGDLLRWRRAQVVTLQGEHDRVVLHDQCHLMEGDISLTRGWSFGDLIEYLNEHVYFWPGTAEGPTKTGLGLQQGYDEAPTITIRIPTADLFTVNAAETPLFCPYNPSAPREPGGRKVRRGPLLYTTSNEFIRREREVVELAFRGNVSLPDTTALRHGGEWIQWLSIAA